jgi:hypothetical protein
MHRLLIVAASLALAGPAVAADPVELNGAKSTPPAEWKSVKPGMMRSAQFSVPKADGDSDDGEVSVFVSPGQSGGVDANVKRQVAKFKGANGGAPAEKTDKIKVGTVDAIYQDLSGIYTPRVGTPKTGYRQLYVIFEGKEGLLSVWLLGPEKTVEKHKAGFEEWLKNFK